MRLWIAGALGAFMTVAANAGDAVRELPLPDPPPVLCLYGEDPALDVCADLDLEADTAVDVGSGDVDLYSYAAGPGRMTVGYRDGRRFVVLFSGWYLVRSWEGSGRIVRMFRDDDLVFRGDAESEPTIRWSAAP